jgi:hypothetical protein
MNGLFRHTAQMSPLPLQQDSSNLGFPAKPSSAGRQTLGRNGIRVQFATRRHRTAGLYRRAFEAQAEAIVREILSGCEQEIALERRQGAQFNIFVGKVPGENAFIMHPYKRVSRE